MNTFERTLGEMTILFCKLVGVTPAQLERVRESASGRSRLSPQGAFKEFRRSVREADSEQTAAIYRLRYGCPAG